jgi:probable HAF family extracellular repeat protein
MTRNKSAFTLVALLLALLSLSAAAVAPTLTFTFKDVKAPGATETDSYAINNAGTIAGDYVDSSGTQHGMILSAKGKLTSFDNKICQNTGGVTGSTAVFGINKSNAVAGWCLSTKTGLPIGWVYANKKFTTIAFPKAPQTVATGINDNGDVVGFFVDSAGTAHGFVYANKKYKQLNVTGATETAAWAIDNAGDITVYTGSSYSSGTVYCPCTSFLFKGKKQIPISDPNASSYGTVVHAVNNKGDIDGTYYASSNTETHGFLLHSGKYYDVEDPNGPSLTRADGLNDSLTIDGRYTPSSGGNFGFEATTK